MLSRAVKSLGVVAAASAAAASAANAAGPPPPTSTNGHPVQLVASGLGTPTSFAFGGGNVFEGDGGPQTEGAPGGPPNGGVFLLKRGTATKLPGSPNFVAGLVWHKGTLYVSAATIGKTKKFQILAWSGWNGTTFKKRKAIYTGPKKFDGFNGLAWGPDRRLYAGVDVGLTNGNDHGPANKTPFLYDILSLKPNGKDVRVFAKGMRQPWQIAFPAGSSSPLVSDLGEDTRAKTPPDFLLRVRQGDNYGFPNCNWIKRSACKGFTKPFKFFAPHTNVMGVGIIGKKVYLSEFLGNKGQSGLVVSMPVGGGKPKTLLTGFVAPVVGLGVSHGYVYVGELTGQVFRVKA
jgi:glucose/arabinose dehydrogenase